MSNIQNTLDSLQPYVIGIRYVNSVPVVDVLYKDGWTVPETRGIVKIKGDDSLNYYMIYSDVDGIGLDELLEDVKKTIKHNIDREKKHELLRLKINELKELFKRTTLSKLTNLKFVFTDDDLIPSLNDFDSEINLNEDLHEIKPAEKVQEEYSEEELPLEEKAQPSFDKPAIFIDENNNPIELSEEEIELMEEEARAKKNLEFLAKKSGKTPPKSIAKIELPPRTNKRVDTIVDEQTDCECGPNEACSKCIDKKSY